MNSDNTGSIKSIHVRRESLSSRDIADVLFRKKLWITTGLLLICLSATAFVAMTPLQYKSQMLLLVKDDRPEPSLANTSSGVANVPRDVLEAQIATEVQLLTSDELLSKVIVKRGLVRGDPAERAALDLAVGKLKSNLRVIPGVRSNLITISVIADSPENAAGLLTVLSEVYLERQLEIHKVAGGFQFFREQTANSATELHTAQNALAEFERKNKTVLLDQEKTQKVRDLATLEAAGREVEAALTEAHGRNRVLEGQLTAMSTRITTQSRVVPNQYSAERLNTMLLELRNKRTELLTKFKPTDRMIQQTDQQIAQTIAALQETRSDRPKEEATDVNPIRQTLEQELLQSKNKAAGLSERSRALAIQRLQLQSQLQNMSQNTGEHDDLVRDVKEAESRYEALATQLERARLAEQMDQQHIANVVVAEPPTRAGAPLERINVNTISAVVLGAILVLASAFIIGMRRRQIFTPWELEGIVGAPVLGTLPVNQSLKVLRAADSPLALLAGD